MFSTAETSAGFLLAAEHGIFLATHADIADVLAKCLGAAGLILTEQDVCADFFVLGSGLAGETFQKFTNYQVPLALVISDFGRYGRRFAELAREHAAHRAIRFVHTLEEARAWLLSLHAKNPAA
jgi:hypothetical protein